MTPDVLVQGLRWTFWVLAYLAVVMYGAVIFIGAVPLPTPVRWAMFAVVLWAIAEDVKQKLHPAPHSPQRPQRH